MLSIFVMYLDLPFKIQLNLKKLSSDQGIVHLHIFNRFVRIVRVIFRRFFNLFVSGTSLEYRR